MSSFRTFRFLGIFLVIEASPVAFHSAASAQSAPVVTEPADPESQVKCRKVQVTGSLIRKGKVCRTLAEWKRLQQLGNAAARLMVGENGCSGGECRGFEPEIVPMGGPQ